FALLETGWSGESFLRASAVALAGYVLLAQLPVVSDRWFRPTQTVMGGLAVVLSVGVALVCGESLQRTAGPIAGGLVLAAGVLLALRTDGRRGQELVYAALSLAVLLVAELGWAFLDLRGPALGLRRSVALVTALAIGTVGFSFGLARRL